MILKLPKAFGVSLKSTLRQKVSREYKVHENGTGVVPTAKNEAFIEL